ncbi:MAG: hypothetical protein V3W19_16415 [Desulfatiglandales bacterium]
MEERFEKYSDEYLKFERVENKKSKRADLHGFLLLDELFPGNRDMISAAEHDEIWLDIEGEQLEKLTDEQIIELTRCGIRYDEESNCLAMFA